MSRNNQTRCNAESSPSSSSSSLLLVGKGPSSVARQSSVVCLVRYVRGWPRSAYLGERTATYLTYPIAQRNMDGAINAYIGRAELQPGNSGRPAHRAGDLIIIIDGPGAGIGRARDSRHPASIIVQHPASRVQRRRSAPPLRQGRAGMDRHRHGHGRRRT
jgi:hypothetical protein